MMARYNVNICHIFYFKDNEYNARCALEKLKEQDTQKEFLFDLIEIEPNEVMCNVYGISKNKNSKNDSKLLSMVLINKDGSILSKIEFTYYSKNNQFFVLSNEVFNQELISQGKIFAICGKSLSGKTTIVNELVKRNNDFIKVKNYTTRPKRYYETNENGDYIFIDDDEFEALCLEGKIISPRAYSVSNGEIWKYGVNASFLKELKNDQIGFLILDIDGIKKLKALMSNIYVCYIEIPDDVILERSLERGDNKNEVLRRLESDRIDFVEALEYADHVTDGTLSLDNCVKEIENLIAANF